MKWPTLHEVNSWAPMPEGYRYKLLSRADVPRLIAAIKLWYPDITVGTASGYVRENFYDEKVTFDGENDRKDVFVLLFLHEDQLVGMVSIEREPDALAIYARLGIVDPAHRGRKLATIGVVAVDAIATNMGAEFLYGTATMKHPYAQLIMEEMGYRLLGFLPGYDRERTSNGEVVRVYEAAYAKIMVAENCLPRPDPKNQTPKTRALFELLFPQDGNTASG